MTSFLRTQKIVGTISRRLVTAATGPRSSRDTFGDLSRTGAKSLQVSMTDKYHPEDADNYDKEEFDLGPRKNAYFYKYEIRKYARQGAQGLKRALELFQEMKCKDRLTPTYDSFAPLIYGCAKAGFTKRAFELYQEMGKYEPGRPSKSIVNCLITACTLCPFQEYGYERLKWLQQHLKITHNYTFDKGHHDSLIVAYGRLGRLDEASNALKEMMNEKIMPDTTTFNMFLIGCASNKEAGTTLALRVFKRLKLFGLQPNSSTYHYMARCIRDCKIGSPDLLKETLEELPALTTHDVKLKYKQISKRHKSRMDRDFEYLPMIEDLSDSIAKALNVKSDHSGNEAIAKDSHDPSTQLAQRPRYNQEKYLQAYPEQEYQLALFCDKKDPPNLLSDEHLELMQRIESINLNKIDTAIGRLQLFGGLHGFLQQMDKDYCKPDARIFSLLLCCLDHKRLIQIEYFRLSGDYKIERTTPFYNLLISHVCDDVLDQRRFEFARDLLEQMELDGLRPDINTYEVLARGCNNRKDACQFIHDVERAGISVTNDMVHNLMVSAIRRNDFDFMTMMLDEFVNRNIKPNKRIVESLEERRLSARDILLKHEKGLLKLENVPPWLTEGQIEHLEKFQTALAGWLKKIDIHLEQDHPWNQFEIEYISRRGKKIDIIETIKPMLAGKRPS